MRFANFLYFFSFFWLFSLPCPKCFAMTITSCDLYKDKASRPRAQNARVLSVGKKKIRSWLSRPTKTTAGCVDGMGTSLFKLARHRKQYLSLLQKHRGSKCAILALYVVYTRGCFFHCNTTVINRIAHNFIKKSTYFF